MERAINITAAIICIISVIFTMGHYFGTFDTSSKNFNDRLTKLENQNDRAQDMIKNIDNQLSYIRGYLSKAYNNTATNFNVGQAIKASSEISLPPSEFNQIFSAINLMPAPTAKKYLKEKTKFSDEQINAILKINKQ